MHLHLRKGYGRDLRDQGPSHDEWRRLTLPGGLMQVPRGRGHFKTNSGGRVSKNKHTPDADTWEQLEERPTDVKSQTRSR